MTSQDSTVAKLTYMYVHTTDPNARKFALEMLYQAFENCEDVAKACNILHQTLQQDDRRSNGFVIASDLIGLMDHQIQKLDLQYKNALIELNQLKIPLIR